MSFELKEAEISDVDEIGAVLDKAHANDPLVSQLMTSVDAKGRAAFWAGCLRGDFSKPGEKLFKMVESSTGYVRHFFQHSQIIRPLSLVYPHIFHRTWTSYVNLTSLET
jgi:hypothetical protein